MGFIVVYYLFQLKSISPLDMITHYDTKVSAPADTTPEDKKGAFVHPYRLMIQPNGATTFLSEYFAYLFL
jgi:hypothetical protein